MPGLIPVHEECDMEVAELKTGPKMMELDELTVRSSDKQRIVVIGWMIGDPPAAFTSAEGLHSIVPKYIAEGLSNISSCSICQRWVLSSNVQNSIRVLFKFYLSTSRALA